MFIKKNNNSLTASKQRSTALRLYGSTAGFTALEMLIAVAIIVILLGIVVISLRDQGPKNRNAERRNEVNAIADALATWSFDNNTPFGAITPALPISATCVGTSPGSIATAWDADTDFIFGEDSQGDVGQIDVAIDSSNFVYVVWRNNYDIYAQKLDQSHNALWGAEGVRVNQYTTGSQRSPSLAVDNSGNVYVAWTDARGSDDIYAQKLNSSGASQWGASDMRVNQYTAGSQNNYVSSGFIDVDSSGNVYVAWTDARGSGDIYAQKLNSSGASQWGASDIRVNQYTTGQQGSLSLDVDGSGNVYIAWTDARGDRDIYAQKLNSSGAPQWGASDMLVNQYTTGKQGGFTGAGPSLAVDSSDNIFVVWADYRSNAFQSDVYAQKFSASGSFLWGVSDLKIPQGSSKASYPKIASDGLDGAYIVWQDDTTSSARNNNVYAQHIDSGGTALWGAQDKKVSHITPLAPERSISIEVDLMENVFITWYDYITGNGSDMLIQKLQLQGACYDLSPYLASTYLNQIPEDPKSTNGQADTGYTIYRDTFVDVDLMTKTKEIIIGAPRAENGDPIEARRK